MIAGLDDARAAALIADDDLDILVDLSTHTRGARPGILARKPARVQITHIASAGSVGLSAIDYKLTDRYADVPENQEFQIERLLAMDGCVFPFRHVAPASQHPFDRRTLGLAADAIVIGAFVSPLKLSRRCLGLWRDVLARIPRAALAFSPANPALRDSYLRLAQAAGIARERLLFLPQGRDDAENQARYRLVDFVLDTMPYGGVNGTIEALDMGVPVVTLVGKRHGERTSFSILRNLGVTATIAETGRDYVEIAGRLADDAGVSCRRAHRDSRRTRPVAAGRHGRPHPQSGGGVSRGAKRARARRLGRRLIIMADPRLATVQTRLVAGDASGAKMLADAMLVDSGLAMPDRFGALVLRSRAHEALGDLPNAIVDLDGALAIDATQARVWNELGLLCADAGMNERAVDGVRACDEIRSRLCARMEQSGQCAADRGPRRRGGTRGRTGGRRRFRLRAGLVEPGGAEARYRR